MLIGNNVRPRPGLYSSQKRNYVVFDTTEQAKWVQKIAGPGRHGILSLSVRRFGSENYVCYAQNNKNQTKTSVRCCFYKAYNLVEIEKANGDKFDVYVVYRLMPLPQFKGMVKQGSSNKTHFIEPQQDTVLNYIKNKAEDIDTIVHFMVVDKPNTLLYQAKLNDLIDNECRTFAGDSDNIEILNRVIVSMASRVVDLNCDLISNTDDSLS